MRFQRKVGTMKYIESITNLGDGGIATIPRKRTDNPEKLLAIAVIKQWLLDGCPDDFDEEGFKMWCCAAELSIDSVNRMKNRVLGH